MDEEILTGGNSNVVTRRGDTVRRPAGPWTTTIHALLRHVRRAGLLEVPAPLGIDEQGREVLSFRPGVVAGYPLPDWLWAPRILTDAGRLLRRLHDATTTFDRSDAVWQLPGHEPAEVVCHNDVAPYNLVFTDGRLTGLIDFDTASPGPRIWDFAYLAYRLVPFVGDAGPAAPPDPVRDDRLAELTAAYGWPFRAAEVGATLATRLTDLAAYTDQRASETGRPEFLEHAALYRRDATLISRRWLPPSTPPAGPAPRPDGSGTPDHR